ncbi:hypothetical protein ACFQJC_14540 [Haloferax namakaokahaiae]|uniref:Uncharacterized protein n=1 Tax=Haloferax namakaokahaiae TaxID=1748331 RepID=A0ABD5ZHG1_9EURY
MKLDSTTLMDIEEELRRRLPSKDRKATVAAVLDEHDVPEEAREKVLDRLTNAEGELTGRQLGALRRAWGAYIGAIKSASQAFGTINSIRADAGQTPLDHSDLYGAPEEWTDALLAELDADQTNPTVPAAFDPEEFAELTDPRTPIPESERMRLAERHDVSLSPEEMRGVGSDGLGETELNAQLRAEANGNAPTPDMVRQPLPGEGPSIADLEAARAEGAAVVADEVADRLSEPGESQEEAVERLGLDADRRGYQGTLGDTGINPHSNDTESRLAAEKNTGGLMADTRSELGRGASTNDRPDTEQDSLFDGESDEPDPHSLESYNSPRPDKPREVDE